MNKAASYISFISWEKILLIFSICRLYHLLLQKVKDKTLMPVLSFISPTAGIMFTKCLHFEGFQFFGSWGTVNYPLSPTVSQHGEQNIFSKPEGVRRESRGKKGNYLELHYIWAKPILGWLYKFVFRSNSSLIQKNCMTHSTYYYKAGKWKN